MRHAIIEEDLQRITSADLPWDSLSGKTGIITGATGLLPSYMVETLLFLNDRYRDRLPVKVLAVVRDRQKAEARFAHYLGRSDLQIIQANLAIPFQTAEKIDFIVHGASPAAPNRYLSSPDGLYECNVIGTYHLLNLAKEHHSDWFLLFSSSDVYGKVDPAQIPIIESTTGLIDPALFRNCYAESKRAAENMSVCWYQKFGVPVKIVRPSHTFGPGLTLDDGRVFGDFISDLLNHRPIKLNSDGTPLRTFCYVADAVEAYFTVIFNGESAQPYNVCNPACTTSIRSLAEMLAETFGQGLLQMSGDDEAVEALKTPSIWPSSTADVSRILALGWRPQFGLKETFGRTLASLGFEKPGLEQEKS